MEDKPYYRNRRFPGGHSPALSPCRLHSSANLSQRMRSPDLSARGAKRHATRSPRDQGPGCGRKHAKIAAPHACSAALESWNIKRQRVRHGNWRYRGRVTFNMMWVELCPPPDASRLPGKPAISQFEQMLMSIVKQLTQWKRAPTISCRQLHPHQKKDTKVPGSNY